MRKQNTYPALAGALALFLSLCIAAAVCAQEEAPFTLPADALMEDGSIGKLQIPTIDLTVSVYDTTEPVDAMAMGAAKLPISSAWNGHVALVAHNRGVTTFFGKLYQLQPGDLVQYETALGVRSYRVESIAVIDHCDWTAFERTTYNQLSLVTCVADRPTQRLCVRAVEIE